jgi:two-component system chemotaxis response regulator CheY
MLALFSGESAVSCVLVIDDDPVVTSVYEGLFASAGFDVKVAQDGEDGLASVHRWRPDAVLLDLSMPKLNGLQWLQSVRADQRFEKLPVIVFTAGQVAWQLTAAKNSSATRVISKKSADPAAVVQAVSDAILMGGWSI